MQRFLNLKELSLPLFWFPKVYDYAPKFIQIYWHILSHKGSSNLTEQKTVICPVIRLLKGRKCWYFKFLLRADEIEILEKTKLFIGIEANLYKSNQFYYKLKV